MTKMNGKTVKERREIIIKTISDRSETFLRSRFATLYGQMLRKVSAYLNNIKGYNGKNRIE